MIESADTFMVSTGLRAYRVGGSVRDQILGRPAKDADYVVFGSSLLEVGSRLKGAGTSIRRFNVAPLKLRDGRQAGWRVSGRGLGMIEVVLPRKEVSTGPGHRDFKIVLDPNLTFAEDAIRRDFTFNAMYLDPRYPNGALAADPLDGYQDLLHRRINVTHADSFRDDPLRMLRALRFVSTLGYELGQDTLASMFLHHEAVANLSLAGHTSGTVLSELSKLLMGRNAAEALRVARDTGVLASVLPELAPMVAFDQGSRYHDLTTDEHTFKALHMAAQVELPLRVRWALLFHDSGKPEAAWVGEDGRKHYYANGETEDHEIVGARIWESAAKRLNADKTLRKDVTILIENHMVSANRVRHVRVRRERVRLGDDMLRDLYMHRMCDLTGKGSAATNHKQLKVVGDLETERRQAALDGVPISVRDLAIHGGDLMALGISGRQIGEVLNAVLDRVVCQPGELQRSREWQLAQASRARTA